MKYTGPYLKRAREASTLTDTIRFIRDKAAEEMALDFELWGKTLFGGRMHVTESDGQYCFYSYLGSIFMDFSVHAALLQIGVNSPCRTMGDICEGKRLGHVPVPAILEYREKHSDEISAWLKAGVSNGGFINNGSYRCPVTGKVQA